MKLALEAIEKSSGTEDGEYGIDAFVTHHIEELPAEFWKKYLNTATPTTGEVISILVLLSERDMVKSYDFTLPDDVTNYVVCVRFSDQGVVEDVSMES